MATLKGSENMSDIKIDKIFMNEKILREDLILKRCA